MIVLCIMCDGGEILNRHLSRMQFTFPDINVGLNVCNTTKQHDPSGLIRTVSVAPIRQICMRTHDSLRPRGRGRGVWINGSAGPWGGPPLTIQR